MKSNHQINSGLQFRGLPDLYRLHHLEHWHFVVPDDPGCGRLQGPGGDPPQPETRRGAGEGPAALPGAAGGRLDRRGVLGDRGWDEGGGLVVLSDPKLDPSWTYPLVN